MDFCWKPVISAILRILRIHLVDLAGPDLQNSNGVATCLGLRSIQTSVHLLQKNWNSRLSHEERELLVEYGKWTEEQGEAHPFPELTLSEYRRKHWLFFKVQKHHIYEFAYCNCSLYKACVKVFNTKKTSWLH